MPVPNYTYYRALTIDNTGQAAINGVQVRVVLYSLTFDFTKALSNGHDLRFTDSDQTTLLNFWRQRWDATNGVAEIYVLCNLPSNAVKTIYLYYGNAAATDASSYDNTMTKAVQDTSTLCLLHCDEGNGTPIDATGSISNCLPSDLTVIVYP